MSGLKEKIARDRYAEAIIMLLEAGDRRRARLAQQKALEGATTPTTANSTAALTDTRPGNDTTTASQPQTEARNA